MPTILSTDIRETALKNKVGIFYEDGYIYFLDYNSLKLKETAVKDNEQQDY